MSPLLEASALSVARGGREVVRQVSVHVLPGQRVAVLGPNGAGKSTLVRALLGLVGSTGALSVGGVDPRQVPRREVALRAAFVAQESEPSALEGLPVLDVVLLGRAPHLKSWGLAGAADVAIAKGALKQVGLESFAGREASTLSGGERRLVLLARALAQSTPLVVLDEPTAFLDVRHHHVALEAVSRAVGATGAAVAVLHDVAQARAWATHVVLLREGAVVAQGDATALLTVEQISSLYGVTPEVLTRGAWAATS